MESAVTVFKSLQHNNFLRTVLVFRMREKPGKYLIHYGSYALPENTSSLERDGIKHTLLLVDLKNNQNGSST